jgi:branched-chain amino acid transport system substrate-binding protein
MNRFLLILLAIALAGALIFSGCPQPATTTPTQTTAPTTTAAPTQQPKVLKFGTVQALNTADGVGQKKWYDLFAKLINEQGGWEIGGDTYEIDMIVYDSQNDATMAKTSLEKLVLQDGVKFVFGTIFGVTGSPAVDITVTEPNKVINVSGDVTSVSADPNVQYFYAAGGTYFGQGTFYRIYKDMVEKGVQSYVSLKTDNEYGHYGDMMNTTCWDLVSGGEVKKLDTIYFATDTTDFAPIATKVKNLNPDVVDMNYAGNVLQCYTALKDAGYEGIILPSSLDQELVENLVTQCGKEYLEGVECFSVDPRGYQTDPEMLALMDAYVKEYGEFRADGLLHMAPWFVLKDAIENTQSVDVEVIKAYLDNSDHAVMTLTTYTQLMARPDLGNYRTICGNPVDLVGRIHDGKLETFASVGPKTHYLSAILAYGQVDIYKEYWEEYGYPTFPDEPSAINFSDLGITGHD